MNREILWRVLIPKVVIATLKGILNSQSICDILLLDEHELHCFINR